MATKSPNQWGCRGDLRTSEWWQEVGGNSEQTVRLKLTEPVRTRAVRVRITTPVNKTVGLAEVYLR